MTELPDVPQLHAPFTVSSSVPLIHALRDLQQARARSMQPTRDVLEAVILRAERETDQLDVAGIGRILTELDRLDEEFLQEVRRRVPIISSILIEYTSARGDGFRHGVSTRPDSRTGRSSLQSGQPGAGDDDHDVFAGTAILSHGRGLPKNIDLGRATWEPSRREFMH